VRKSCFCEDMCASLSPALLGLALVFAVFTSVWLVSLYTRNVSIVDTLWGLSFLLLATAYTSVGGQLGDVRSRVVFAAVLAWSVRLATYLTWRNWRQPEDPRYAAMREYWGQSFWWVSWFTVFGLQALLSWIIAMPLYAVFASRPQPWGAIDGLATAVFLVGLLFEMIADWQLARFKTNPANRAKVLRSGLWRYSRHPNYFGESLVWWGFYLFALAAGAWWTVFSPLLMTYLLLRVSGVPLLESNLAKTKPEYLDYVASTSAFFPWWPRSGGRGN
jgi:steroid 5-alpha reductase family enzyme